jgi:hypothetical protein
MVRYLYIECAKMKMRDIPTNGWTKMFRLFHMEGREFCEFSK